ncbi:MAG TPA: GNAT family N-acetyltransferase [Salinimicrobium sp.]|nr:GNAT family N-acetyltransferase [Salinimicrobium sp.]
MTIFAEKRPMDLSFNKILKSETALVIPFLQTLMENEFSDEVLEGRLREMFDQPYECYGIYLNKKMIGIFGLWFLTRHFTGKSCEPDHVFILPQHRNKGIGKKLFDFVHAYARKKGCDNAELDSFVGNHRSHKFYLNENYEIKGYHFIKKL